MILMCLMSCFATIFEVQQKNLYAPSNMQGRVRLVRDASYQFTAMVGSEEFHIKPYNVRGLPDGVTNEELGQADMYFRLTEEGLLQATPRLRGGDPVITWTIIGVVALGALLFNYFTTGELLPSPPRPSPLSAADRIARIESDKRYARENPSSYTAYQFSGSSIPYDLWKSGYSNYNRPGSAAATEKLRLKPIGM